MADESDEGDKQYEPSQRKLDRARDKGDIPRSPDLVSAVVLVVLVIALTMGAPVLVQRLGATFVAALEAPAAPDLVPSAAMREMLGWILPVMALLLALGPAVALVTAGLTQGMRAAPDKLKADISKLSPLKGLKQRLGRDALMTFGLAQLKLWTLVVVALAVYGRWTLNEQAVLTELEPGQSALEGGRALLSALAVFAGIIGTFGAADYLLQRWRFTVRMRMSRKELVDEHKEAEGDPQMKGQRRQRGQEIAMNRMMADVPKADVVIVNPTHYAVALKWSRAKGSVPTCVAKGTDEVAARIRNAAQLAGVPIHSDPPTARAIHATVAIGREIRPEHYRAVAIAIRFAETMRQKARRRIV